MQKYTICNISLNGCDACTQIILPLTDPEIELLTLLEQRNRQVAYYSCMPTLKVTKVGISGKRDGDDF